MNLLYAHHTPGTSFDYPPSEFAGWQTPPLSYAVPSIDESSPGLVPWRVLPMYCERGAGR